MNPITIDVISDVVCPWCYVGKRHLEAALDTLPPDTRERVEIRWHPFQLNPDLPREGISRKTYVETKFGGAARAASVYDRVTQAGAQTDIAFAFDKIEKQPNTLAAHALIAFAQDAGKGDAVVERLFQANFLQGQFVGDIETLVSLGAECGLNADDVRAFLMNDANLNNIAQHDAQARAQGISGVPFFIIGNQFALSGAQPAETMARAIVQAGERVA
jgi:predicted DsbA family dithiol-disulfide isomerase